jgi:tetratricopeptide (TPR) repeat protein
VSEHPTPRELRRFTGGTLPPARLRSVLAHLIRCSRCGEAGTDYDAPIDRAVRRTLRRAALLAREREDSKPAVAALRQGRSFLSLTEKEAGPLRGTALVESLLEVSWSLRHHEPGGMIEHAELALLAARRLEPRKYGWPLVANVRARVWGELANAYRVSEDLVSTEEALLNAVTWANRGSGDPLLAARLGDISASLWSDLRRFPLAIEALERVVRIYRDLNETHRAARALISQGIFRGYNDEPERAILDLADGLALIDEEREPALVLAAFHAISWNLVECGNYRKARIVLFGNRHRYHQDGSRLNLLRLAWLEGRIYSGFGNFEPAEAAFQKVRSGFAAADQHYDAALASLDLAMVWSREGRREELKALVTEMVTTFRRHGIAREAIAALMLAKKECGDVWVSEEELHDRFKAISLLVLELQYRRKRPAG